jgi:hypothetical protein
MRSAGVAEEFVNQMGDPAARIQRCLDEYAVTGDPACILGEAVEQDVASLMSAVFADQSDEGTVESQAVQWRLLARLFWQRFLSRDVVQENEPMANVSAVLAPREAGESGEEMLLSVAGDPAATADLVAALWLYAAVPPEGINEIPDALRPLWEVRRELSDMRFWRAANQIAQLLEEFDRTGDARNARQALDAVLAFPRSAPGIMLHLTPHALSRYTLLYCDALACQHACAPDIEALEGALSGLEDALALGVIRGQDRFRAAEIIMRTMTEPPGWTSCSPGAARAAMEMLRDAAVTSEAAADRERSAVLLGKLMLFWSEHDQDPGLLDQAIDLLRESSAHVDGTVEHFPVLWGLHTALTRRFTRSGTREDQAEADQVLMVLANAPDAESPHALDQNLLLAQALEDNFDRTGDTQALYRAFDRYRAVTRQLDDNDTELLRAVLTQCSQLLVVIFEETDDPNAAEAAVDAAKRALHITSFNSPDLPRVLVAYGSALGTLAMATGDRSALAGYVARVRSALTDPRVAELPKPDRADLLAALARALHDSWEGSGDHALLREALRLAKAAIGLGTDTIRRDSLLSLTGVMLAQLADIDGDVQHLNEAIAMQRAAVNQENEADSAHPALLENLALSLFRKYQRTSDMAALQEAGGRQLTAVSRCPQTSFKFRSMVSNLASISAAWVGPDHSEIMRKLVTWQRQVIDLCRPDAPNRVRYMASLSLNLLDLARRFPESGAELVNEAIAAAESALNNSAGKDLDPMLVEALAKGYLQRADDPEGPRRAIAVLRDFGTRGDHTEHAVLLYTLGDALAAEHARIGDPSLLEPAQEAFRLVATTQTAGTKFRIEAAKRWGDVAFALDDIHSACDANSAAVGLLDLLAWRGLRDDDQKRLLAQQIGLARTAAAFAIECNEYERAVELLEQGRGILLGRLAGETGYEALHAVAPELAARLRSVQARLDNLPEGGTGDIASGRTSPVGDVRAELAQEHAALVAAVRELPGWQEFLRPPSFGVLADAAAEGPVVLLNTSALRCDALIVTPQGVRAVPLPAVTEEVLHSRVERFLVAVEVLARTQIARDSIGDALALRDSVADVLEWLWKAVAEPVLTAVGQHAPGAAPPGSPTHLWWCPTGNLALLPLHAAGRYGLATADGGERTSVLDRVTSSYTPTLRSLLDTRPCIPVQPRHPLHIAVSSPGWPELGVDHDVQTFLRYFPRGRVLRDGDAIAAEALSAMADSDWVQFTCHAQADFTDPFASGVILADRPATAREMHRAHGRAASTALLLGCTTGRLGGELGDEAISLATTLRSAGFAHVVGTLWPVDDEDASFIAEHILRAVTGGGGDIASMVHAAVRALRDRVPHTPSRWAAFIHVGG